LKPDLRLIGVKRAGNRIEATLVNEYSDIVETIACDRMIIERGTTPMDQIFHGMRSGSRNDGVIDLDAFVTGAKQNTVLNDNGSYELYRIGDAVSSRDIHAAMLDAMRLCKDI
jgi:hypothetical protein